MEYRTKIEALRHKYLRGEVTLDEAKKQAQPLIDQMNAKAEKIAKEFGKRHKKFTFGYLFR